MPFVIPIEVQIPPTYNVSVDELTQIVSRYAQAVVDSADEELEVLSMADAARCQSVEESKRIIMDRVHSHFMHV